MGSDKLCICTNCEWSGPEELVLPDIPDYFERVDTDQPEAPVGECPECRCLAWYPEAALSAGVIAIDDDEDEHESVRSEPVLRGGQLPKEEE